MFGAVEGVAGIGLLDAIGAILDIAVIAFTIGGASIADSALSVLRAVDAFAGLLCRDTVETFFLLIALVTMAKGNPVGRGYALSVV